MDDDTDAAPAPAGDDLLGHLRTLRAGWWLILALTAVGALAGAAVAALSPTVYESTTSVLVLPTGQQDTNATGGRTHGAVNLDTEAQLVTSTAVAGRARTLLHTGTPATGLAAGVSVSVPPNSTVLDITYSAPTAAAAQAGSHAFATAYLANRTASATSAATDQATALRAQIQQVTTALQQLSGRLAALPPGSAQRVYLDSQRANLSNQLNDLTGRLNTLTTTAITAGRIISDAPRPTSPASPSLPVDAAAGLAAGLVLGITTALVYGRLNPTVRRAADLPRRTGVAVLASLTDPTSPAPDLHFAPHTPAATLFAHLRNELTPADTPQVIAVVGTSDGWTATLVAVNLAEAINRAAGDRPEDRAVVFADCAEPTGDVPAKARQALADLRTTAAHVLVVTPSATDGPDAQTLAGLSDAAILAVELNHSHYAAVTDAAHQIHRVSTPVLGAVVLPRLTTESPESAESTEPAETTEATEVTAVEATVPAEPTESEVAESEVAESEVGAGETVPAGRGD
jgi:capsular polysaccharide biosynthesis protein